MPKYCFHCGFLGHSVRDCPTAEITTAEESVKFEYGSWLSVTSPVRSQRQNRADDSSRGDNIPQQPRPVVETPPPTPVEDLLQGSLMQTESPEFPPPLLTGQTSLNDAEAISNSPRAIPITCLVIQPLTKPVKEHNVLINGPVEEVVKEIALHDTIASVLGKHENNACPRCMVPDEGKDPITVGEAESVPIFGVPATVQVKKWKCLARVFKPK
ncbi:hypothetical protein ACOSQ4_032583 [Xanthoceras sorbifolium]